MSGVHAVIAPSSLARIVQCPGSLVLCKPYEDAVTPQSREGTVAHEVAMFYAVASGRDGIAPDSNCGILPKVGDEIEGVRVDQEMIEGAKMYAEALEGFAGNPEQTINIPRIHPTLCFGTPDFWQYSKNTRTLRITDYKYGHAYVEVFENYQLIAYAAGILDKLAAEGVLLEFETIVEFMIVQPRCYSADSPVRTWTTSPTNLRSLINLAATAAELALSDDPPTQTGPECLHCDARANCDTASRAGSALVQFTGRAEALAQTGADMGVRLNLINAAILMLKAVGSGLEEQIIATLRAGKSVPFFKVDYSKPRETWAKSVAEVKLLGQLSGVVLVKDDYDLTPKQAVKAGIDRAVIDKYSFTPNGAAKLVPDKLSTAQRIFSK
jgi:hypothetical protein